MGKKVAIVGCAESKVLAPFDNKDFEIWGVNNLYPHLPRATRWFEIHEITHNGERYFRRGDRQFRGQEVSEYLEHMGKWAKEKECPVYMQKHWDIVPTSVEYPLQAILDEFGDYFTNTISWELALAIYEGFEEIHIYGVDMAVDTEYHHQRPSCEYFLGIAKGRGIKIYIPSEADLLKARHLYGFQEPEQRAWKKKVKSIMGAVGQKKGKAEKEKAVAVAKYHQFVGAEQAIEEVQKLMSNMDGDSLKQRMEAILQGLAKDKNKADKEKTIAEAKINQYIGAEQATKELDKIWGLYEGV